MIFFSHKCGQLGNRLFAFAHLIGNAAAHNNRIANLSFDEYAQYFQTTSHDVLCRYPPVESRFKSNKLRAILFMLNRVILKLLRNIHLLESPLHNVVVADLPEYKFEENRYFELDTREFWHNTARKPVVFLFGRFFRDYSNFDKYQDAIRSFFRPTPEIKEYVDDYIKRAKRDADIVIGVHVRRGDYKDFAFGKYYFEPAQYLQLMKFIETSVPGKKVKYVICSNEELTPVSFSGVEFCIGPGHLVKDMYILAQCDFIMGPPSTFSLWSSFYGNKPLYQVRDIQRKATLNDFVILPPHVRYDFSVR